LKTVENTAEIGRNQQKFPYNRKRKKMKSARKISSIFPFQKLAQMHLKSANLFSSECAGWFLRRSTQEKVNFTRAPQKDVKKCLGDAINAQRDLLRDEAKRDSHDNESYAIL
jgi:hypothetical protein